MTAFGAAVKRERERRKLTRVELAKKIGRPVEYHTIYETETNGITQRHPAFLPLCLWLGLDPKKYGWPLPEEISERYKRDAASEAFGAMARGARKQRGVTVKSVAEQIGVLPARLSAIECHGSSPKSSYFFRLCEILDLKPEDCGFKGEFAERIADWRFRRERERKEA